MKIVCKEGEREAGRRIAVGKLTLVENNESGWKQQK